jgi:hypothetical protein
MAPFVCLKICKTYKEYCVCGLYYILATICVLINDPIGIGGPTLTGITKKNGDF